MERVLRQQHDVFVAFMDPVTDEIAPNYSMVRRRALEGSLSERRARGWGSVVRGC